MTSWVEQNCTAVPASAYDGTANGGSATSAGVAVAAQALYRCN